MAARFQRVTCQLQTTGYNDAFPGLVAQSVEQRIENPCVGGSIPPRATKNIVHATPAHRSGRCRFCDSHSSAPVYFRFS
jgi:hypothetical protein